MISEQLYNFTLTYFKNKNVKIDMSKFNEKTDIYKELNIHELDMDLFMSHFIKEFNIDDSKFQRTKYFGTGILLVDYLIELLNRVIKGKEKKKFTFEVLDEAINTGFLE